MSRLTICVNVSIWTLYHNYGRWAAKLGPDNSNQFSAFVGSI